MEQLVPIGQFAALTRLSQKALRLYAETGLLPPARVDPDSGYRYYSSDQVGRARLIWLLRAVDMPLVEIGAFLREPTAARLDGYGRALQARHIERERVLRYLRRVIDPGGEPMTSYEVKVKEVATQPYVSRTATVAIGGLEPFIVGTIRELTERVEAAGPPFTVFLDPVNDEADGRVEVCVPTAERQEGGGELPAGTVAYTVAEGAQTDYPEILAAYDAVTDWAKRHGHELIGPPREIALAGPGAGQAMRLEIAWPIR